ncbi:MAG: lipid-A-disaccharide synthase [Cyanobacteria bacterium SZAS TMP-1]|nr:lipid-A-disaccharide synthase [Cyanobacteria bacterium SZAS TMP-1]
MTARSLMIVVGDHSAEKYTARIIERLKQLDPELTFWGVGGPMMQAQGMELLYNSADFAVIGVFETLNQLQFFLNMFKSLQEEIQKRKPAAILLVDFGGFNRRFATRIRKVDKQTPIYYFISPQVWASRPWRINELQRAVTKMLTTFPFEESLYLSKNLPARFVGHPLTTILPQPEDLEDRQTFFKRIGIQADHELIAIMPGSRRQEIKSFMPVLLQAIKDLCKQRPNLSFVISNATAKTAPLIQEGLNKGLTPAEKEALMGKRLFVLEAVENYVLMKNSDLVWAKSGTTTLEVTLYGRPMIIFYRGNWLTYFLVLLLKTIKHVGLPNLLAGKLLVPELIQLDCRAELLVRYSLDFLDVPALRREIEKELLSLRQELGSGDFVENCAQELLAVAGKSPGQGDI